MKKFEFWKIHSQNRVGQVQSHASKRLFLWLKTFFQRLLEIFLSVVWTCSIYLEGRLTSYLYTRKILESNDTSNRLYGRKRNKSLDFEKFTLRIGLVKCMAMLQKGSFLTENFFSKVLSKFSMRGITMFKRFGRIISLRSKEKSESYDSPNKLYGRKLNKSLDFEKFTLRIGLVKYKAMVQKSHFFKAKLFFKGS